MERRLAAILAADVVGYSRLMEADEVGVLGALKSHRDELINPRIADHHGTIVKLMGDGALVEFASVVDAVECALAIQRGMAERNAEITKERRIDLRIGVHLGDVIVEGEDIYGDGVNIAARLEGLSEPGGICISQQAFDQIETKLDLRYEDLGDERVKNIARPVHAYRIRLDGTQPRRAFFRKVPRRNLEALAALLVLGLAAGIGWQFWSSEPASVTSSIAVLPFDNIGGEESTGRLADGITEDIITDLARFPEFEVVARHSIEVLQGQGRGYPGGRHGAQCRLRVGGLHPASRRSGPHYCAVARRGIRKSTSGPSGGTGRPKTSSPCRPRSPNSSPTGSAVVRDWS